MTMGSRPITNVKSNASFKRVKMPSINKIQFVSKAFKNEKIKVFDNRTELKKIKSKDGNKKYVKKGINSKFANTVIQETSKKWYAKIGKLASPLIKEKRIAP